MNIIETFQLSKKFAKTLAVEQITMHVRQGEIYGFLGLNGAGKSTTIRMLLGLIKPTAGSVCLFGQKLNRNFKQWNDVGYLVEEPHAYPELSVWENLQLVYRLRKLDNPAYIDQIIERLNLSAYRDKKAGHLSSGNNQRLGLAKALMHQPKLLILDEPVNGLDPAGIVEIREYLKELAGNHGTTVFLSSHILSEIAKLATRIGIVDQGQLVKEINSEDLDKQITKKLYLESVNNLKALPLLNTRGYNFFKDKNDCLHSTDPKAIKNPETIATLLVKNNLPPKRIQVVEEDLESFFLRSIGKEAE